MPPSHTEKGQCIERSVDSMRHSHSSPL
uniref:Uncharacterized protein n=1 Tax=Anguilla anguilla TaxID=7936 RepID=A0A0E9WG97_ANGAN